MNRSEQLRNQLIELYHLARFQRCMRLGLRAFWLGVVGVLAGWCVQRFWGWLPDPRGWLLAGFAMSALPLAGLLATLSQRSRWVWTMDRRLGLQEQVSTAWEVTQREPEGDLAEALVEDVLAILPDVKQRMMKYGWFLERDLVSVLIVLLLGGLVLVSSLVQPLNGLIGQAPEQLSILPQQSQEQKLPAQQQPAEQPSPGTNDGSESTDSQPGGSQPGESGGQGSQSPEGGSNAGGLADTLQEMGDSLGEQAPTYDLGQALQQLDLNGAAEALDTLADQLDQLSPETRERLAEAFGEGATSLQSENQQSQQPLAGDLQDAAGALQRQAPGDENQDSQAAKDALDAIAGDLRELAGELGDSLASGPGAGGGQGSDTGNPEPVTRLEGEGGNFELPLEDSGQAGILSPAPSGQDGDGTAAGSQDSTIQPGDDPVQNPLIPNSFLWKWRDVVSEYFRR